MTVVDGVIFGSIGSVLELFRRGELSPTDLLEAVLARQEALEPRLNAFTTVLAEPAREQAREAARALDRRESLGPLTGIPLTVKDIFDIAGARTTVGSRIMRDFVAIADSAVYRRLRAAGAVIVGKTNMLEFAYGAVHPDYGQSNNPWDTGRTTGGSSSGSAGAVAAGIGYGSIGTDTGGSIRVPASFCGLVGMKPTHGSVETGGLFVLSPTLDHIGPLTRTVADNRLLLEVLTGRDLHPAAPTAEPIVGVIRELLDATPDPDVRDAFDTALDALATTGARIHEVSVPGIADIWRRGVEILGPEASHAHRRWLPDREHDYSAATFASLMGGRDISAITYLGALEARREFTALVDRVLGEVDFLATPTMPCGATRTDPAFDAESLDMCVRTIPFDISGHPAISVPAGCTPGGLPLGLELVGRKDGEGELYAVAEAYESAVGGFPTAPIRPGEPAGERAWPRPVGRA
jgi:aspartyl-tRNA(Asn)/glutamyl-tRNA(Gln) amidotransferase subunit A